MHTSSHHKWLALTLYGLFFYFSIACLSLNENFNEIHPPNEPYEKTYDSSFEQVWKALQATMKNYPLKNNDIEQGLMETKWIKKKMYWKPTQRLSTVQKASRYKIKIQVLREEKEDKEIKINLENKTSKKEEIHPKKKNDPKTQVFILKTISRRKDFFSNEKSLPSDGIEEQILLYRIQREIEIAKKLNKAFY